MKVIFDLDYTLLDTDKFKEKLVEIFKDQDFYADYKKYFEDSGLSFDYEKYLALLKYAGKIDGAAEKEIRFKLTELMKKLDDYLRPDAENVLKYFHQEGAELILITFGEKNWQQEKVKSLDIKKYFDRIRFEDKNKNKSAWLKLLKNKSEEILIINDNAKEAKEMVKILGKKAKVFLIDGPYSRNIKHNWPINKISGLLEQIL